MAPFTLTSAPVHGDRGEERLARATSPCGLTVAISREAGARGGSIARRVGKRLGWQVYTQELLEFLCANEAARQSLLAESPPDTSEWVESQLGRLRREIALERHSQAGEMPRLILTLAARGQALLVGRGAGYYLPKETSLHIRIVAPLQDRISHMADWLRLTREEAAEQVRLRDERRAEFLSKHFGRRSTDIHDYAVVLNSAFLGEETCADAIVAAINGKEEFHEPESQME